MTGREKRVPHVLAKTKTYGTKNHIMKRDSVMMFKSNISIIRNLHFLFRDPFFRGVGDLKIFTNNLKHHHFQFANMVLQLNCLNKVIHQNQKVAKTKKKRKKSKLQR